MDLLYVICLQRESKALGQPFQAFLQSLPEKNQLLKGFRVCMMHQKTRNFILQTYYMEKSFRNAISRSMDVPECTFVKNKNRLKDKNDNKNKAVHKSME